MDAMTFYGLRPSEDPRTWVLPVEMRLCSGTGFLFGGAGLGSCVEALERATGRPAVWATAQFLNFAPPGQDLVISVTEVVRGHQVSQARAVGRVDGEEILTVNAALGHRDIRFEGSWSEMPVVPGPDDCRPRELLDHHRGTIADSLEVRMAKGRMISDLPGPPGDGRIALWVRIEGLDLTQTSLLAIFGDFVPMGIGQALGERAGGNSLDNTLRIARRHPTDWVLADVRVHAVNDGFGHGLIHLWSQDGVLLATASQSTIVRQRREDRR